jgi:hypothetical protein
VIQGTEAEALIIVRTLCHHKHPTQVAEAGKFEAPFLSEARGMSQDGLRKIIEGVAGQDFSREILFYHVCDGLPCLNLRVKSVG